MGDLVRSAVVSTIVSSISLILATQAFATEGCTQSFFSENQVCKSCRDLVNPLCNSCDDRSACNSCDRGYYPIDNQCLNCRLKDLLCLECSSLECTKCDNQMFISNGKCTTCLSITGCVSNNCDYYTGCKECRPGYYLDAGKCKLCSLALAGCKQCRNADVCTLCGSDFLTIQNGRCICRNGVPN